MNRMKIRHIGWMLAILLVVEGWTMTALAQKIVFTPQWTAQAQFAGYYVA